MKKFANILYDPNNLDAADEEARKHDDTSEGIDWDEIIATTEPDWRAGRYKVYNTWEDFSADFKKMTGQILTCAPAWSLGAR